MQNKLLNDNDRISLCLDIAEAILEADHYEVETVTDKQGNQHYAEDTQDRFNGYFDMVEGILHDHGLIDWEA
jgi:hypothetical protein